jgi:hypothetical protein
MFKRYRIAWGKYSIIEKIVCDDEQNISFKSRG